MEPVDRVRESRKQAQIAYDDLADDRDPDDVLSDLARAEECLARVIGTLDEEGA